LDGDAKIDLKNVAQGNSKKHCGKCGESGHSIRAWQQMKAVSAARFPPFTGELEILRRFERVKL
jgi:hypothetical protein